MQLVEPGNCIWILISLSIFTLPFLMVQGTFKKVCKHFQLKQNKRPTNFSHSPLLKDAYHLTLSSKTLTKAKDESPLTSLGSPFHGTGAMIEEAHTVVAVRWATLSVETANRWLPENCCMHHRDK